MIFLHYASLTNLTICPYTPMNFVQFWRVAKTLDQHIMVAESLSLMSKSAAKAFNEDRTEDGGKEGLERSKGDQKTYHPQDPRFVPLTSLSPFSPLSASSSHLLINASRIRLEDDATAVTQKYRSSGRTNRARFGIEENFHSINLGFALH